MSRYMPKMVLLTIKINIQTTDKTKTAMLHIMKRASEPLQKRFGYRFWFLKKLKNGLGSGFGY